ncbi:hypothetical protein EDC01DRAFT_753000 [Geopyxis carbonaria]|nr:hypothetical protein EDC01DRAFT_753000 [Geopyxis carbonaria]
MSDNQDALVLSFCEVTGAEAQAARHFLEASNWNLESATAQFYESNDDLDRRGDEMDEDDDDFEQHIEQSSHAPSTSAAKPNIKPRSNISTLRDLGKDNEDDDDEDADKKKQDFFAGGEKSGLAVQDPNAVGGAGRGNNLINDILRRAAEGGQRRRTEEETVSTTPRPRFTGSGHTLGSDSTESIRIPDPSASTSSEAAPRGSVTRALTFWRDGFSVEDGPLMRYEDPANAEILQAIENGRAPLSLMNVEPGQAADVNVFKRLDEDYIPPKKKFKPFSGQGQRLGSVTPGESSSSAPIVPVLATPQASAPTTSNAPSVSIDTSSPVTNLQIRLGDGARLVSRFNHTHTVDDVYNFVNASSVASQSRAYVLQTTFPNRELKDLGQTLKEAGLINAVVVQKWLS